MPPGLNYPEGIYPQYYVACGYYPKRTIRPSEIRYGPGPQFGIVQNVGIGKRVGVQSERNPSRSSTPPQREAVNGYVWVFVLDGGRSGWMKLDDLRVDEAHDFAWAIGPAQCDFEVGMGRPDPMPKPRFTLGWKPQKSLIRIITADDVYIRHAVRSTAFGFLLKRDRVRLLWHHRLGFSAVEVLQSKSVPPGTRGWVNRDGFSRA